MGDSAGRQRGLCRQHGRRAGGLSETARSAAPARVSGRDIETAERRDAHPDPGEARTQGASRLRIPTQWRRQSVHAVRAAGRLAACDSDRPPHRHRLCPYAQGFVGRALSRRSENRAGAGQSQHPQASLALCGLSRARGAPARRALRMAYTPKHGSWLDMAESELGVLASQCLDRRIADKPKLIEETAAWQAYRNKHHTKARWHFTTNDARIKLSRLYPQFE